MTDDEKELKDQRVVTMMTPSELEAIDDWMFENRIRSRGEAIRRLCQIGIVSDQAPLMRLTMSVLAHFVDDPTTKFHEFASGQSLEIDTKRLCWAVFEQQTKLVGLRSDPTVEDGIKAVKEVANDFRDMEKGTHLKKK